MNDNLLKYRHQPHLCILVLLYTNIPLWTVIHLFFQLVWVHVLLVQENAQLRCHYSAGVTLS